VESQKQKMIRVYFSIKILFWGYMKLQNSIKRAQVIWNLSEYREIIRSLVISKLVEHQQNVLKLNRYTSKYGVCDFTEENWMPMVQTCKQSLPELK
jgi:hypothetical protein